MSLLALRLPLRLPIVRLRIVQREGLGIAAHGLQLHSTHHGFTKVALVFPIMRNETAKSAKHAKFFSFLGAFRGLSGLELLSDINLVKPYGTRPDLCLNARPSVSRVYPRRVASKFNGLIINNWCYASKVPSPRRTRSPQRFLKGVLCVLSALCGETA
jgi:hypothetical protein